MVSKEEIKKLAELARVEIKEEELEKLRGEMDAILDYVGQVKSVAGDLDGKIELGENYNVMREDEDPHEPGRWTEEIIREMPETERGYLKVKKIL